MTRRDALRLGGAALAGSTLFRSFSWAAGGGTGSGRKHLFFGPADISRIRANTTTPLLRPMFATWQAESPDILRAALDKFEASGEIIRDFLAVLRAFERSLTVHLVATVKDPEREASLIDAIERLIERSHWDFFRDGGEEVLGIQRSSFATVRLLYAREVLGTAISPALDQRLLRAIAEKGCVTCHDTIYDMENPETAKGWDYDPEHKGYNDITMERWPTILGANNLRAAPTGALGLGALALRGHDPRAEQWLETAVASTRRFLRLLSPDGSYFEGLSYLDYSMRTTLPFLEAHSRIVGDIDWHEEVNWDGVLEYIITMQMGRKPDGTPDIVNFSDARRSVYPGSVSKIGEYTGNPMAGFVADAAGEPTWFYDYLWYRPAAPSAPPPARLLNHRNALNWIICRSGWEAHDAVLAFKSGGPNNHEHADRNHLTYKINGERMLQDHFGASYDRRTDGWKMRFTRGHNGVLIDGEGHHYVDGTEGVNESLAYANITQFADHGAHVWWTGDATAAYSVINEHVKQVLRTVLFAKPGVIVIFDQVRLRYLEQPFAARFYPDNDDGAASLAIDGNRFRISRPAAELHGLTASANARATPHRARLEVQPETGDFPCIEVRSPAALTHQVLTVLAATTNSGAEEPNLAAIHDADGNWTITAHDVRAVLKPGLFQPTITMG